MATTIKNNDRNISFWEIKQQKPNKGTSGVSWNKNKLQSYIS